STVLFSDFENDGVMWAGDGARKNRTKVKFGEAFRAPPSVQVSLSMWDLDQKTNPRADISATDVSATGFTLLFQTWGDTRIARVRADWLAIGEMADGDEWDVD
ncbi:MAG: H-type lectin domain-containing protein, partial [Paracoccaceae bacterium]